VEYKIPEMTIARAREHVQVGERYLTDAASSYSERDDPLANAQANLATAHFSAAMAITNVLLTDPAEAPDLLEH
jgi:hypothetical protein